MRNLAFVIWLVCWPLTVSIDRNLSCLTKIGECKMIEFSNGGWILLLIYICVASAVYEGRRS